MRTLLNPSRLTRSALLVLCALLLWLAPSNGVLRVSAAGPYLYITNSGSSHLVLSNLDGTSPVDKDTLGGALSFPSGIALDTKHQKMYIANIAGSVVVANLDGSSPSTVTFTPAVTLSGPGGIALDLARGQMYIANYSDHSIIKANLDGSSATRLDLGGTLSFPWGIALDTYNNWMYVTSHGDNKVVRARLDGTNASTLTLTPSVTLSGPTGIALDFYTEKMYITNSLAPYHLIRANLDGTSATDLSNPGNLLNNGEGIAVDHLNQKLYIVSKANNKIVRTDLNGGNATELVGLTASLNLPYFVAFDTPPDLRVSLSDNAAGGVPFGSGFDWNVSIYNNGPNPAVFESGEAIFRDDLPSGPTYSVNSPNLYRLTYTGSLTCSVVSDTLTCSVTGGKASFAPGFSYLMVSVAAVVHDMGTLTNPRVGGVCRTDPGTVSGDTNLTNNTCTGTVTVNPANLVRGRSLYVLTINDNLARANLDGSGGTNLGNPGALLHYPHAIALDWVHEKLYMTNIATNSVIQANVDGTGGVNLGNVGGLLSNPNGIALDVANSRMYVVSGFPKRIVRADLNGASATTLVDLPDSLTFPYPIALDLVRNRIYVAGYYSNNLYRVNLDGSGGQVLGNLGGLLSVPQGIAVDAVNGRVYVASIANSKLLIADLDGNLVTDLGNLGGSCPYTSGVALDVGGGRLYVSCSSSPNSVARANLDGSNPTSLGNLNGAAAYSMAIALDLRAYLHLPLVVR